MYLSIDLYIYLSLYLDDEYADHGGEDLVVEEDGEDGELEEVRDPAHVEESSDSAASVCWAHPRSTLHFTCIYV